MHVYQNTESGVIPMHYVEKTTRPGELRPTRITDVKKWLKQGLDVAPSVTTILNVLDKAALTNWKVKTNLECAFKHCRQINDLDLFLAEVKRISEMEMDQAPTAGTNIHEVLEDYFNGKLPPMDSHDWVICKNVWDAIQEGTGLVIPEGEAEVMFCKNGYGGCVDLVLDGWIIDYKTKLSADKFKPGRMAYPDHARQLAAYRQAINPTAQCANIFICIETGEVDFHPHSEADLKKGWQVFEHALKIWQINNE